MQGLLRGPALSIDGRAGHLFRQAGGQPASTGDISGLGADGVEAPEDPIIEVFTTTVDPIQQQDTFAVLEQMGTAHPSATHWYLPWFGVDAALQSQGLGSELMHFCLGIVDEARLPAYLETPNPRNIPFYERHGFTVTGAAQAGACPPVSFMWREAR